MEDMAMAGKRKKGTTIKEVINCNTNGCADEILHPLPTHSYTAPGIRELARLIRKCADSHFLVITDFDPDGECAGAEMKLLFDASGITDYEIVVCSRSDGYGPKPKHLQKLAKGKRNVVMELDMGIRAFDFADRAKAAGAALIVVDHHLPDPDRLPHADLIVDPHADQKLNTRGKYVYRDYCAAGLVCKLAQEMLPMNDEALLRILSITCIATITDVVPLTGDNRNLFRDGVRCIRKGCMTKGLKALVDDLETGWIVDESDIGFRIGPMLNAPGRLYPKGGKLSYLLLCSMDDQKAKRLVRVLKDANEKRKRLKAQALERAQETIQRNHLENANPLFILDPDLPPGIAGLVAGALSEKYQVTTIACSVDSNGLIRGSARAARQDHLMDALSECARRHPGLFTAFGGHKKAAGLTLNPGKEDLFVWEMGRILGPKKTVKPDLSYDLEVKERDVPKILQELLRYAPFGEGNPKIVFHIPDFRLSPKDGKFHTEGRADYIRVYGNNNLSAVSFEKELKEKFLLSDPREMAITGYLSEDHFQGEKKPQIEIIDFDAVEKKPYTSPLLDSISGVLGDGIQLAI